MNKYLDAAAIALEAIWAAKLRSFMTVLGNIVAVTSIIAVVSLIQGLNASVKEAAAKTVRSPPSAGKAAWSSAGATGVPTGVASTAAGGGHSQPAS